MNYIHHLNKVFELFYEDNRLNTAHISLYMALFQYWNMNRFKNPITIHRAELMKASKIGSVNTYVKALKELGSWQYLEYKPSYNPHRGSTVNLYTFDKAELTGSNTTHELLPITQVIPLINVNKLNNKPIKLEGEHPHSNENLKNGFDEFESNSGESDSVKKAFIIPNETQVSLFFKEEKYPEVEAKKFFNYFESNGWKVGGKTPMKDWKAAARNWMLNAQKFSKPQIVKKNGLNSDPNKDYSEPL
jgi:hypothetical protein